MKKGLTLIELILYIALFSVITVSILPILIDQNFRQIDQSRLADSLQDFLSIESIVRTAVDKAQSIEIPRAASTTDRLMPTEQNGHHLEVRKSGSQIELVENDGLPVSITSADSRADSLTFSQDGSSQIRKILFSLSINGLSFGTTSVIIPNE